MSGSNNYSDPEFDNLEQGNGGGGLRKLLEDTLAENKKLREAFEGKEREKTATALLTEKGLDPALAEIIPQDTEPQEWVEKYAHLLGAKPGAAPEAPKAGAPEAQGTDEAAAQAAALAEEQKLQQEMNGAQESGSPAPPSNDLLARLDSFEGTAEQLEEFFKTNGASAG